MAYNPFLLLILSVVLGAFSRDERRVGRFSAFRYPRRQCAKLQSNRAHLPK